MKFESIGKAKRETGLSYLGAVNSSAKIAKGKKIGVTTYVLYLAPANESGYNVCPFSTPECRAGCLATSGRVAMELRSGQSRIVESRIKKTRLFFEHNQFFMDWLRAEIEVAKNKAKKEGNIFTVRLNGTSDIAWEEYDVYEDVIYPPMNIFDIFHDVQFYDYTKHPLRTLQNKHDNYHLTLSYTGHNEQAVMRALKAGYNVAMVFDTKKGEELPSQWNGIMVVDGDETDYRPIDPESTIIGLRWKRIADKEAEKMVKESVFVVKTKK